MVKCDLFYGDCVDVMDNLIDVGVSVDLTVTSPPYDNLRNYNNSLKWDFDIFKNVADRLYRITKKGGVVVWVVNDATIKGSETGTSFRQALYFKDIGFNLHDTMIYFKRNHPPYNHNRYEQCFEYMFVFSKGKPKTFNGIRVDCKQYNKKTQGSFYKNDGDNNREQIIKYKVKKDKLHDNIFGYYTGGNQLGEFKHPATFPVELALDNVRSWSDEEDIVFDCFMGSGTTGVACKELNRDFMGVEIEKKYFDVAKERLSEFQSVLI